MKNSTLGVIILSVIVIFFVISCFYSYKPVPEENSTNKVTYKWDKKVTSFSYTPHLKLATNSLKNNDGVFSGCFYVDNYKKLKQFDKEFIGEFACLSWNSKNNLPPLLEWNSNYSTYFYKLENGQVDAKDGKPLYFKEDSHTLYSIEVFFSNLPREKIIETMNY